MAFVVANRVRETTTTTGTGTITLGGAATGFQTFAAVGNGNSTYYTIAGQGTNEWEVGIGTYTASGTTLSRDLVLSSSAGGTTKVNFSSGTKDVFVDYPAEKAFLGFTTKTANYTAGNNEGILANTAGGAFTVTLPASPLAGWQVIVADDGANWGTNNLTVGRNGSTINGLAENLVCDISGVSVQLVYDGSTWNVYAQIGGNGGTVVTEAGTQTLTNKTLTSPIINGIPTLSATGGGEGGEINFNNPDNASVGLYVDVATADTGRIYQTRNNSFLQIGQLVGTGGTIGLYTAANLRAYIDASGNVGLGLIPVANNGILQLNSYASVQALLEKATVSATAATGTINYDAITQAVLYYTTNASANWTLNIRGNSGTSLNTIMQTGQSLTVVFMATNGATPYYPTALQVDGSSVTPKWQGGSAPTSGNASSIDVYSYTVIKTASATFTVLASQTQFK